MRARSSSPVPFSGMRPELRNGFAFVALGLAVATSMSACGGSTTSRQPAQYEAEQRIDSYVEAVNKAGAPFHGAATAPQLRTAIAELAALTPPSQFQATYRQLIRALRGELSAVSELERGERTHDAALIRRARAEESKQLTVAHAALAEAGDVLTKCQHDNFSC